MIGRKKKQRTPQQIRRRFRFASGLILVMVAVVILGGIRRKHSGEAPAVDPILASMNAMLDSALRARYGEGTVVTRVEEIDKVTLKDAEEERYDELKTLVSLERNPDILGKYQRELDSLVRVLNGRGEKAYQWARRFYYITKDGTPMTAIQVTEGDKQGRTIICLDISLADRDSLMEIIGGSVDEIRNYSAGGNVSVPEEMAEIIRNSN